MKKFLFNATFWTSFAIGQTIMIALAASPFVLMYWWYREKIAFGVALGCYLLFAFSSLLFAIAPIARLLKGMATLEDPSCKSRKHEYADLMGVIFRAIAGGYRG